MADEQQTGDTTAPDLSALSGLNVDEFLKAFNDNDKPNGLFKFIVKALLRVIQVVLNGLLGIATFVVSVIQKVLEQGNEGIGRFSSTVVGALFGHEVADNVVGSFGSASSLADVSEGVGHSMLLAIFGSIVDDQGGELQPGVARAEGYLGAITEMVTRGFLLGAITEFISVGQIKLVHELEEELIGGLGLGRIARTVMRPFVQTLIAEPAQWAINLAYRPKLHTPADAVRLWNLGELSDAELDDECGRQGWSSARVEHLKDLHLQQLGFDDAMVLTTHGVLIEDDVTRSLTFQGVTESAALHRVAAWHFKRLDAVTEKMLGVLVHQYTTQLISESQFRAGLNATGRPADELQQWMTLGGLSREVHRRTLSKSELLDAWKNNILTQNEVHDGLIADGYSEEDATTLVLMQLAIGQHAADVAHARAQAAADRAKAKAEAAAARAQALAEKHADEAAARLARQQQVAQEKAASLQAAESRREFVVAAAAQRHAVVDAAAATGQIAKDQADALKAQITADEQALVAQIVADVANANATYQSELLTLKSAEKAAAIQRALDDLDLAQQENAAARAAGVDVRLAAVDALLQIKLADHTYTFDQQDALIATNLAAALAALSVAQLPTTTERQAASTQRIADEDTALASKLVLIDADYDDKASTVTKELGQGILTAIAAQKKQDTIADARAAAKRSAQQAHDVHVQALTDAGGAAAALAAAQAAVQGDKLQLDAQKAHQKVAADRLMAAHTAQSDADREKVTLQAIVAQQAPLSAAAAQQRKQTLTDQLTALQDTQKQEAATIQHAQDVAKATAQRAQDAVTAARQKLALLTSTQAAREAATAATSAQLVALEKTTETNREQLEQRIIQTKTANAGGRVAVK